MVRRLFFQAEDGIRDRNVTGVQTCALPIWTCGPRRIVGNSLKTYGADHGLMLLCEKSYIGFSLPLWPHFKGAAMTTSTTPTSKYTTWESPAHKRTVYGVLAIVAIAILFDGYDLVIYGAVLPNLLADPTQIGQLSAGVAGTLG